MSAQKGPVKKRKTKTNALKEKTTTKSLSAAKLERRRRIEDINEAKILHEESCDFFELS